jgi:hypothetical protein
MFVLFCFLFSVENILDKVRSESYENQGLTKNYSVIDYQVSSKNETFIIEKCFFDIQSAPNRTIWFNNDKGIFVMYKTILTRTTGFRAWRNLVAVNDSCGFECQEASGNGQDGRFCWIGQLSNDEKFSLTLQNINLFVCGKAKVDSWTSLYAKGWDSSIGSRVIKYISINLTNCYVNQR